MKKQLMKLNYMNQNGRIYNSKLLQPLLNKKYFGEISHPGTPNVDLSKISHEISNLRIEEDILYGDVNVLDTPQGKKLNKILSEVIFRPRALGNINEQNVVENFELIAFDAIPKNQDSFNLEN